MKGLFQNAKQKLNAAMISVKMLLVAAYLTLSSQTAFAGDWANMLNDTTAQKGLKWFFGGAAALIFVEAVYQLFGKQNDQNLGYKALGIVICIAIAVKPSYLTGMLSFA